MHEQGQALSAICSIAKMTIQSRISSCEFGYRVAYSTCGEILSIEENTMTAGTIITIANIFKEYPPRMINALKNIKNEIQKAIECIKSYSIYHYSIDIHVESKERVVFKKQAFSSIADSMDYQYPSISKNLTKYAEESTTIFLCPPNKECKDKQLMFINGRIVKINTSLKKALNEQIKSYCPTANLFCIILLTIPHTEVDANVAHDKTSLIIHNESKYMKAIIEHAKQMISQCVQITDNNTNVLPQGKRKACQVDFILPSSKLMKVASLPNENHQYSLEKSNIMQSTSNITDQVSTNITQCNAITHLSSTNIPLPIIVNESKKKINKLDLLREISKRACNAQQKAENRDAMGQNITTNLEHNDTQNCQASIITQHASIPTNTPQSSFDDQLSQYLSQAKAEETVIKLSIPDKHISPLQNSDAYSCLPKLAITSQNKSIDNFSGFNKLHIIGQFNKGFIICKDSQSLFIIDQHAADEKVNYEQLMHSFVPKHQLLLMPYVLKMDQLEVDTIQQYSSVIASNGFQVSIGEADNSFTDVIVRTLPTELNYEFGIDDFKELVNNLMSASNEGGQLYSHYDLLKPSKIRKMIATKACRKSIMIGDVLSDADMKRILENLSRLVNPWNCPHGRPVIRALSIPETIEQSK